MQSKRLLIGACAAMALCAFGAHAGTTVVTTLDGSQGWTSPPGENTGGGKVTITNTPIDGAGSVAVTGDRSRLVLGSLYGPGSGPGESDLGTVSQFTDLAFSYEIDPTSVSNLDPKYSPALALTILNGDTRDELIYEAAYQPGGYAAEGAIGTLNITSSSSLFYLNSQGDPNDAMTLAQWATTLGGDIVGGVYVGVGSDAGSNYLAHVDDVVANGTTYNFELAGGVPEPASWAMMLVGFAGLGGLLRRRRTATAPVSA
jgi:hypothetical protein